MQHPNSREEIEKNAFRLAIVFKPQIASIALGVSKNEVAGAAHACEDLALALRSEIDCSEAAERIDFPPCLAIAALLIAAIIGALASYVIAKCF